MKPYANPDESLTASNWKINLQCLQGGTALERKTSGLLLTTTRRRAPSFQTGLEYPKENLPLNMNTRICSLHFENGKGKRALSDIRKVPMLFMKLF